MHEKTSLVLVDKRGFFRGGGEGSRTPVRKSFPIAFYECSFLFGFFDGHTTNKAAAKAFPIGPIRHRETRRISSPLNDVYISPRSADANGQLKIKLRRVPC